MEGKHVLKTKKAKKVSKPIHVQNVEPKTSPTLILGVALAILAGAALSYCTLFSTVLYPVNSKLHSELGTVSIGLETTAQAEEQLLAMISDYTYQIKTQMGKRYDINLADLTSPCDETAINQELQDVSKAFFRMDYNLSLSDNFVFDDAKIQNLLDKIVEEQGEAVPSEDAKVVYDDTQRVCVIQPEKQGNVMAEDAAQTLKESLASFSPDIDLVEAGCYVPPALLSTDPSLQTQLSAYNSYAKAKIVYTIGDITEELRPERYFSWITLEADGTITVDEKQVLTYVEELSAKYNTYGFGRAFTTSTGEEILLKRGDYGWLLSQRQMIDDITAKIKAQDSTPGELLFAQRADKLWDGTDFSNSYVEISIDNQELWMYVNGELIVDTSVVTGCVSDGNGTPRGIYSLTSKSRNAILRGEGYETPVSYWMPFNGGVGLHDASWRSSFGDSIYIHNGSHGCVNIPPSEAKTIYENLSYTMPIIVW